MLKLWAAVGACVACAVAIVPLQRVAGSVFKDAATAPRPVVTAPVRAPLTGPTAQREQAPGAVRTGGVQATPGLHPVVPPPGTAQVRTGLAVAGRLVTGRIPYGDGDAQFVEVTRPAADPGVRRPTVIFVHGGSWVRGDTDAWAAESRYWARHGWLAVNASYRLGTDDGPDTAAQGRHMLTDMASVLSLTRSLPQVDAARIVGVGDSAGGHLVAWLAGKFPGEMAGMELWSPVAAPRFAAETGESWRARSTCRGDCGLQVGLGVRARQLFGWSWRATDPLTYLTEPGRNPVPAWIAGSADEWVPFADNGARLCAAAGSACSVHLMIGDVHGKKLGDRHPELITSSRQWADLLVSG